MVARETAVEEFLEGQRVAREGSLAVDGGAGLVKEAEAMGWAEVAAVQEAVATEAAAGTRV